jgi:ubiquinone/menaquinone biosynthesis C-methylase UbiE
VNDYSENYRNLNPLENIYSYERQAAVMEYMSMKGPKKILEVGCGLTSLSEFGTRHFWENRELYLIEPQISFFDEAKKKYVNSNSIVLFHGTLEAFTTAKLENNFDFIVINSVLHEIENTRMFLSSARELLSNSGELWINVPNVKSIHRRIFDPGTSELDYQRYTYGRKHYFDQFSLIKLLLENGFSFVSGQSRILKPMSDHQLRNLILNKEQGDELWRKWLKYSDSIDSCMGAELDLIFMKSETC